MRRGEKEGEMEERAGGRRRGGGNGERRKQSLKGMET